MYHSFCLRRLTSNIFTHLSPIPFLKHKLLWERLFTAHSSTWPELLPSCMFSLCPLLLLVFHHVDFAFLYKNKLRLAES